MANSFLPPISIEKFAAYLDGNLSESEMENIDAMASSNPAMGELIDMSDSIDQDIQDYMNDDFLYDADMSMLDETNIEIPKFEDDLIADDGYAAVACDAACSDKDISEDRNLPSDFVDDIFMDDGTAPTTDTELKGSYNQDLDLNSLSSTHDNSNEDYLPDGHDGESNNFDTNIFSPEE